MPLREKNSILDGMESGEVLKEAVALLPGAADVGVVSLDPVPDPLAHSLSGPKEPPLLQEGLHFSFHDVSLRLLGFLPSNESETCKKREREKKKWTKKKKKKTT